MTTPLDLWVHGLMGVEERIGTCTADAVLIELGATHYEREYGPGVHAAGLAVYAGSLYQSSRSAFRALMRVSSGVRNLIAGGGDGGGGGGGDAGAGGAPGASPPPATAETGAASESVTGTLVAGRGAVVAPATALDTADTLTGARRVPLEELVSSVGARRPRRWARPDPRCVQRTSPSSPAPPTPPSRSGRCARRCASKGRRRGVKRRAASGHRSSKAPSRCIPRAAGAAARNRASLCRV